MKKPVSPLLHGIIDYGLVTALLVVPLLLKINKKAVNIYRAAGSGLGAYNAITDSGAGVVPIIPFQTHYKIDYFNLTSLALLGLNKNIRKDKPAAVFHCAFWSLAFLTVVLTNPEGDKDSVMNKEF